MANPDYYKILDVSKTADKATIKTAYRKQARKYHPDVSKEKDAEDQFKLIGEAYETLKDPEKRQQYDEYGSDWKDRAQGQSGGFSGGGNPQDFSDIFSSFFQGGGGGGNVRRKGQDIQTQLTVDLEDIFEGTSKTVTLNNTDGTPKTLNIKIPKGIQSGKKIRLNGQGQQGMAGAGDLIIEINIRPHTLYKVEGANLSLELPLTPWEAALGTQITVPTPQGKVNLKIAENSQSGRKIRLKGRGIASAQIKGDLFVIIKVILPDTSIPSAKALYEEMHQKIDFNPRSSVFT